MRRLSACLALCLFAPVAQAENIVGNAVILRTLDKVTATTQDYTVNVGDSLSYGTLSVDVKHCEKKPPEEIPETFAFLQIFDHKTDLLENIIEANDGHLGLDGNDTTETDISNVASQDDETGPLKLFSGWMLASKPAISALDHPVYDVWVIDCVRKTTP